MTAARGRGRLSLLVHIVCSVGWLGAVVATLALSIVLLAADDPGTVAAAAITLDTLGWSVVLPASLASLISGVVRALRSRWGLFEHYWVVTKLVLNVVATAILVLYLRSLGVLADRAAAGAEPSRLRDPSPLLHSTAALVLLLGAVALSVYKPAGRTRYGWRKLHAG